MFVYGSLFQGQVHFRLIESYLESCTSAVIVGSAFRLKVGFPVVLNQGHDVIPGQLVELKASEMALGMMDEFHGYNPMDPEKSLYHRQETEVTSEDGAKTQAWCYFLNPKKLATTAKAILGGDWIESLKSEKPLTAQLTERQVTYIQKLGKCSGRDIVPIDLPMYRELMNLELIVDKGRRLALSKIGQEVYRYLG
jgi:gamma-glutamylcyclotransferase (GGCT)/AIG2-like uncharacterized protein YtfP